MVFGRSDGPSRISHWPSSLETLQGVEISNGYVSNLADWTFGVESLAAEARATDVLATPNVLGCQVSSGMVLHCHVVGCDECGFNHRHSDLPRGITSTLGPVVHSQCHSISLVHLPATDDGPALVGTRKSVNTDTA